MRILTISWLALVLAASGGRPAEARETFQLGGRGGLPWEGAGQLTFTDARRVPGSLRPLEAQEGENLALSMAERGGSLSSISVIYTLPSDWLDLKDLVVDGDSTTAFVHPPRINYFRGPGFFYTVQMFLDLGAPFPVELIRFLTRPDHPENLISQYDLYVNDGSEETKTEKGDLIWDLVRRETDNLARVVELPLDLETVQHVFLYPGRWGPGTGNPGPAETWEVAEYEVYGRGFVPEASYLTEPIDLGQPSALGAIRWAATRDPGATVMIQSRSGSDGQPEVYWRRTGVGDQVTNLGVAGVALTEADYLSLGPTVRAGITADLENWSSWQTYELEEGTPGTPIRSPSPRQFAQFRIVFASTGLDGGQIDSLAFDYSQPPVAEAVVGEIWPGLVETGESVAFTYSVRAAMGAGHSGFTGLEVRTPALVEGVDEVRIDGAPVASTSETLRAGTGGFTVAFPRVDVDQTLLEVDFTARVFTYGTPFSGAVVDKSSDEVPLDVTAGDAVPARPGDALKVRTTLSSRLLGTVEVSAPAFSPNGDQVNDTVQFSYEVLRLTVPVRTTTEIFDLAGRRVRTVQQAEVSSGLVEVEWDGRGDDADPVPPGSYLYRIAVDSDAGEEARVGLIAVAY